MRAWLEVDLDTVRRNLEIVRRSVGTGVEVIAVVKADAYGMGIKEISRVLDGGNVAMFAVISLDEARKVREASSKPVLIMGYLEPKEIVSAIEEGYVLSLFDNELAAIYERLAARLERTARVHLKVDTGLNRLGVSSGEAVDLLVNQRHYPHIRIEAIFSHLIKSTNRPSNERQLQKIRELLLTIQSRCELLPVHLVNSGALADFSDGYFDAVRIGLAFSGVDETILPGLEPCLRAKSVIVQVRTIDKGEGVSYDHLFIAAREMKVAVVAIGYAEGYSQALSGKAEVVVQGQRVKVLGKICMNFIVIDVTGLDVRRGEEVVLVGSQTGPNGQKAEVHVSELAKWCGLRHHEVVTRLGTSLPRDYYGGR
ncbi:alanine racemase [Candidatus Berkelbacteria bacterium RIFCSPLOWO2_01_FULL_50_28]|uniref:Alanine racemase n=1 Tax=Candidatus Berkelbacteria bacterium RIFCSPLOWO2_01_FULL_50_28 TaxID=1797471 RepID=A0A1F5EBF0_9BACT|nr:MAG: alanine racemase [Candidatus Berkelbacteria bacterium RIFCSPHIGHO2_12_FULL_50_11]OGD64737.1 MAG: alanine racemase [Candidatus Berkelbacteria bacterium RIFCSPLOWO2_01_FULL_50_28]